MMPDLLGNFSAQDSWTLAYFGGLFLTGCLFGFTVCSFSCVPIVCTFVMGTSRSFKSGFLSAMTFAAGRTAGYTIAGMLCGLTGKAAEGLFEKKQVFVASGILFLVTGLSLVFISGKRRCKPSSSCLKENSKLRISSLGLITGIMPCTPYTAIMAAAAASGSMLTGGLSAFCFGIGTCISPLLLMGGGAGWISEKIIEKTPSIDSIIRNIAGILIAGMGLRMIFT